MEFNKNIEFISNNIDIILILFEIYNEENLTKEDLLNLLKIFQICECDNETILKTLNYIKRKRNLIEVSNSINLIDFNLAPNIIRNYLKLLPLLKTKNDFKNFQTLLLFLKECREIKEKYNGKIKLPNFINLSDNLEAIIFDPDLLPEIQETLICTFAPDLNPDKFKPKVKKVVETIYGSDFNLYSRNDISYYRNYISFEYFENIFRIYYNTPLIKFKNDTNEDCYEQKYIQNIINLKPEDVKKKITINIQALDHLLRDCLYIKNGFELFKEEKQPRQYKFNMNLFEAYFEKNNDKYELSDLYLNSDWISDKQNQLEPKFTKEEIYKLKQTFYLNKLIDIGKRKYYYDYICYNYDHFRKLLNYKEYKIFNFSYHERDNSKSRIFKLNICYNNGNLVYTYTNEYNKKDTEIIRKEMWNKPQIILEEQKVMQKSEKTNVKTTIDKKKLESDSELTSDSFSSFSDSSSEY